jgi:hypothetical protein
LEPHLIVESPFILDGIPKYEDEAAWLIDKTKNRPHGFVSLTLNATKETISNRLSNDNQ